jgi:glycosyltransferase involved in cell wall biosynthesis
MNPDLFQLETIPAPPKIDPVPDGVQRPLFSVMIPVCNRIKYLRQTIESVLHENYPASDMQICIVDNSTAKVDWESFLTPAETQRIEIFRQPEHVSMVENWNTCIRQARGDKVHILHDDDFILPGYYQHINHLAQEYPRATAYACSNLCVNTHGRSTGERVLAEGLWTRNTDLSLWLAGNQVMPPAITVHRAFYCKHGLFLPKLCFSPDWEMWIRIIMKESLVTSSCILSAYRVHDDSVTVRLNTDASALRDGIILRSHFGVSYPQIDLKSFDQFMFNFANNQLYHIGKCGNIAQYLRAIFISGRLIGWRSVLKLLQSQFTIVYKKLAATIKLTK